MSAVAVDVGPADAGLRSMRESDLDAILAIEQRAYPFPWTRGIFRDCLAAAYPAWVLQEHGLPIGYAVISVAADEAHILNIGVAPERQGRGHGRQLLRSLVKLAIDLGAARIFLEVRPSNPNAEDAAAIIAGWPPSSELRGNPAAKRALWPQLRALRRQRSP